MSKTLSNPRFANRTLLAAVCAVGLTAFGAFAVHAADSQTKMDSAPVSATSQPPAQETEGVDGALPLAAADPQKEHLDGSILGKPVYSQDGKEVGEVADVIMVNGQARMINVAHGGLLGIGQKHAEVNADKVSASKDGVVVKMSADQLAKLPDVGDPSDTN